MIFLSLFVSCFLAATLLPGGSEALLVYLLGQQPEQVLALVTVASLGNSLGSLSSYGLGYVGRIKLKQRQYNKHAIRLIDRYGVFCLLLSWLPLIGDVLCIIAGYLKLPLLLSTVLIFIGKTLRYVAVAWIYFQW